MKKIMFIALIVVLGVFFASCASMQAKLELSDVNANASKVGVAESTVVLGIFGKQNFPPINEAAKNGGITKVAAVEQYVQPGILGLTIKYKTIVTGE